MITLLQRLEKKGYVQSDRSQHAFVFRAVVTRDQLVRKRLQEVADELYQGSSAPMLLAFAQQQVLTAKVLSELRQLIDELGAKHAADKRKK